MRRLVIIPSLLLFMLACADRNTSEGVAEDFVYVYYKHADQVAALNLSASLAAEKLKDEIELVRTVRNPGEKLEQPPPIEYEMVGKKSQENENQVFCFCWMMSSFRRQRMSAGSTCCDTELIAE